MTPRPARLKKAIENAFHGNSLLTLLSLEECEQAAQWYESFAEEVVGRRAELARLYNLERARFLRGQVARIARNAPNLADEIGPQESRG